MSFPDRASYPDQDLTLHPELNLPTFAEDRAVLMRWSSAMSVRSSQPKPSGPELSHGQTHVLVGAVLAHDPGAEAFYQYRGDNCLFQPLDLPCSGVYVPLSWKLTAFKLPVLKVYWMDTNLTAPWTRDSSAFLRIVTQGISPHSSTSTEHDAKLVTGLLEVLRSGSAVRGERI